MTRASLWHHNGNQDVTKEAAVTMVCGHASHSGWVEAVLWAIFCLYTPESAQIWYALMHHDRIEIDTSISVIVVSPTTWEAHHSPSGEARGLWWASQVVGDTTMTEIEVSIPITSYSQSRVTSMALCKRNTTPVWTHWSHFSLAPSH